MKTKKRALSKREEGALEARIACACCAGDTLPKESSRLLGAWLSETTLTSIARRGAMGRHVARRLRAGEPLPGMCSLWLADVLVDMARKAYAAGELS